MLTYRLIFLVILPQKDYPDTIPQHKILLFLSPAPNQKMQGDIKNEYESQCDDFVFSYNRIVHLKYYACTSKKKKNFNTRICLQLEI